MRVQGIDAHATYIVVAVVGNDGAVVQKTAAHPKRRSGAAEFWHIARVNCGHRFAD